MKTENTFRRYGLPAMFILLVGFGSLAFTDSDVYRTLSRSQRLINDVYKHLVTNYVDQIDIEKFTKSSIQNMLAGMDPYTVYMEAEERDGIELLTTGKYGGVGIQIGRRDDRITVIAPMEDSPAKRAGIISGDMVVKIDGKATSGFNLDEAAKMIRGVKGTVVELTIKRYSVDEPIVFTLTRDNIQVKDVAYSGMLGPSTGYIRLTRFSNNSPREMANALDNLLGRDISALILDLRDNPGGLLNSAIDILDLFIPRDELLLSTRGRTRHSNRTYRSTRNPVLPDHVKLAILVNEGSASASEIVAGVIQDLDRGVVIGQRTFGKGLVQSVYGLDKKRSLKITTAKYYIPSGRLIQKPGYIDEDLIQAAPAEDTLFTTLGGRVVKGGGGITPDYNVPAKTAPPLVRECWRNGHFFSFAQQNRHRYGTYEAATDDENLLRDFRDFLTTKEAKVSLSGETAYQEVKTKFRQMDSTNTNLEGAFVMIDKFLDQRHGALFDEEKDELRLGLYLEFAQMFADTEGRIKVSLKEDPIVSEALKLLADPLAYQEVFTVNTQ